jgi:glycerol-3-phosphate acyltransferase PlsY
MLVNEALSQTIIPIERSPLRFLLQISAVLLAPKTQFFNLRMVESLTFWNNMFFGLALTILFSYAIGALPIGWIVARSQKVDILSRGSGKIGFTNILRVMGLKWAIPVLLLDIAKGIVVVVLARWLLPEITPGVRESIAVLAAMTGHSWSVLIWLLTKQIGGGRSVALAAGSLLLISPISLVVCLLTLILIVWLTRYMTIGTLVANCIAFIGIVVSIILHVLPIGYIIYAITFFVFLIARHPGNISRLLKGTERRIGDPA